MARYDWGNHEPRQGLQVVSCRLCGETDLAWATSSRTGSRYLADVAIAAPDQVREAAERLGVAETRFEPIESPADYAGLLGFVVLWAPHICPEIEARRARRESDAPNSVDAALDRRKRQVQGPPPGPHFEA
jgi:hypothetical protein